MRARLCGAIKFKSNVKNENAKQLFPKIDALSVKIFLTVEADELDANQGGRFNFGTSNRRNLALARRDGGGSFAGCRTSAIEFCQCALERPNITHMTLPISKNATPTGYRIKILSYNILIANDYHYYI